MMYIKVLYPMALNFLRLFFLAGLLTILFPPGSFSGLSVERRSDPAATVLETLKNRPRVMLFITEKSGGLRTANFEQALAETLRQYKFKLVDPARVAALYEKGETLVVRAYNGDSRAAVEAATAHGADIVIVGSVQTSSGAVYSMQSGQADVTLRAILCPGGRALVSRNIHAAALQVSAESAKITALRKAAAQTGQGGGKQPPFLAEMIAAWKKVGK